MRTSLKGLGLTFLAGLALPACSALGLDHLPQADCVQGSGGVSGDAFCASLVDHNPNSDTCHTWQCNPDSHHCEQMARDDDGDGAPSMMCAAGATPDCDDADAHNTPGAMETCNGRDEDCDGIPDDGAIMTMSSSLTTIDSGAAQLAFAMQPDSEEAYLLTRANNAFTGTTITTSATPAAIAISQTGTGMIVPQAADGAISALGSQRYALTVRRFTAPCQQWSVLPVRSGMGNVTLRAIDATLLPACPGGGGAQQVTAAAVAGYPASGTASSDIVLVGWLGGADDARSCGAAPARQVTLGAAVLNDRTASGSRVGATTLDLGMSVSDGPPVILALDDAFLVAYARADMTIAVHVVTVAVDATNITISSAATPAYTEPAGAMVPQGVGLARGPTATGGTTVALSYVTGCGGMNPITVRMLTRSNTAVTGSTTPTTNIGSGLARSRVQVAYQARADEWIVGWRSASGVGAQRLFAEGAIEGDPFDVASSAMVAAFTIEPLTTGPLYRAIVVDGTSLNQVTFGCAE